MPVWITRHRLRGAVPVLAHRDAAEAAPSAVGQRRRLRSLPVWRADGAGAAGRCALLVTGLPLPAPNVAFLLYCVVGGLTQILATNLLIMSFGYRNFAVGTAYSKTETAQSAIVALIVLHEVLRPLAWIGICIGLVGVMTLSLAGRGMRASDLLRGDRAARGAGRSGRGVPVRAHHGVHQARQPGADRPQPVRARAVRAGRHQHVANR